MQKIRGYQIKSWSETDNIGGVKIEGTFTRAPITPKLVNLRYSNGLVLLVVFKKGYKYKGICAAK